MIRLPFKKLIYMEGGCMLDSWNLLLSVLYLMGGLFGIMMSFYIVLCFIDWVDGVIVEKRWQTWKEWIK